MALLFYANAAGYVPNASTNGNWRAVQAAAAGVLHYCVRGQRGVGGVWILSGMHRSPPASPCHISITHHQPANLR